MPTFPVRTRQDGFTRADALAVFTTITLLAGLLLASAAGTRGASEAVLCRANLRQLGQAWQAYALDHADQVIGTPTGDFASGPRPFDGEYWATGFLSWDTTQASTNRESLQMPAFVPYVGRDTRVFRCPSDRYLSGVQVRRNWSLRARSYSMNYSFGPAPQELSPLRRFLRLADVPGPAGFFVFLEEHPDSINDPTFITTFSNTGWLDMPASFHDRSAHFTFADAHVETRRWLSDRTVVPVRAGFIGFPNVSASDPDFRWLLDRTSVKGK